MNLWYYILIWIGIGLIPTIIELIFPNEDITILDMLLSILLSVSGVFILIFYISVTYDISSLLDYKIRKRRTK